MAKYEKNKMGQRNAKQNINKIRKHVSFIQHLVWSFYQFSSLTFFGNAQGSNPETFPQYILVCVCQYVSAHTVRTEVDLLICGGISAFLLLGVWQSVEVVKRGEKIAKLFVLLKLRL